MLHLGRRSYVQVEGLAIYGWCENGGMSERCLQPVEGFLGFGGPREVDTGVSLSRRDAK